MIPSISPNLSVPYGTCRGRQGRLLQSVRLPFASSFLYQTLFHERNDIDDSVEDNVLSQSHTIH